MARRIAWVLASVTLLCASTVLSQPRDALALVIPACDTLRWARYDILAPLVAVELSALGRDVTMTRDVNAYGRLELRVPGCDRATELTLVAVAPEETQRTVDLGDARGASRLRTLAIRLADLWCEARPLDEDPQATNEGLQADLTLETADLTLETPEQSDDENVDAPPLFTPGSLVIDERGEEQGALATPASGDGGSHESDSEMRSAEDPGQRSRGGASGLSRPPAESNDVRSRPELWAAGDLAVHTDGRVGFGARFEVGLPLPLSFLRIVLGASLLTFRQELELGVVAQLLPAIFIGLEAGFDVEAFQVGARLEARLGLAIVSSTPAQDVEARNETDVTFDVSLLAFGVWNYKRLLVRIDVGATYIARGVELHVAGSGPLGWFGWAIPVRLALGVALP